LTARNCLSSCLDAACGILYRITTGHWWSLHIFGDVADWVKFFGLSGAVDQTLSSKSFRLRY
jgi:hypothetical protein